MNYKALLFPAVLTAGCSTSPLPTRIAIDNQPANAQATAAGTRAGIDVFLDPEVATLAGQAVGRLSFHIALAGAIDCPGECLREPVRVTLDGQATTGSFELGGATYVIGPILDPLTNRYVFVEAGDPLALPRGTAAAIFDFHHLDEGGATFQIMMAPLFATAPDVPHLIFTSEIDVDFAL